MVMMMRVLVAVLVVVVAAVAMMVSMLVTGLLVCLRPLPASCSRHNVTTDNNAVRVPCRGRPRDASRRGGQPCGANKGGVLAGHHRGVIAAPIHIPGGAAAASTGWAMAQASVLVGGGGGCSHMTAMVCCWRVPPTAKRDCLCRHSPRSRPRL